MPAHIRKGLITGAPAFSNGGLALSIGTRATRGIRHAIARRAPNGVNTSSNGTSSITNSFKITFIPGDIVYVNNDADTEPHLSAVGVFCETDAAPIYTPLFENKIVIIDFNYVFDPSEIKVILTNPASGTTIESLFTNTGSDVHAFQFPDISHNFTVSDISNTKSLYLNNGKFTDNNINAASTIAATFVFTPNTMLDSNVNNTLIPLIKNKQYKITMKSNSIMDVTVPGLSSENPRTLTLSQP